MYVIFQVRRLFSPMIFSIMFIFASEKLYESQARENKDSDLSFSGKLTEFIKLSLAILCNPEIIYILAKLKSYSKISHLFPQI